MPVDVRVDATKEFSFEQVHQRPGNYSKRYVKVSDATYDLLDAREGRRHHLWYRRKFRIFFRFGLQRRDEVMQRELDKINAQQANYTAPDLLLFREYTVNKFTAIV